MHAALGHGECGATDDEDNGEEMSDLSSVCSCDDPHMEGFMPALPLPPQKPLSSV